MTLLPPNPLLNVSQLQLQRNGKTIIDNLSFQLVAQERLFLQGEIGTGKSTLLHALLGFISFTAGSIQWFGKSCQQDRDFVPLRGHQVGLCFQHSADQLFGPTVLDDVAFGPLNQGKSHSVAYQIAAEELEKLGIAHLGDRSVSTLSGGEQNFTALAGVLAMQPQVLLLDEPTNGLDRKNSERLIVLLTELGLPMLIASHDHFFIDKMADRCLSLG
ncbi:cobalt/nickel transport system ATP-binding protein [Nicoletella semolina]|uniref:Cobalt/nickel transport system ATP-binding protein n=1 Tax=Nicoletella semolina TaxID=271160 RepID=A0A4R2NBC7_9PAST|nr:energy-coupling factor ABC transporter ATP-binding protein [Nicoletella semolina]MDH2924915.1 cobalt ABC transporter ATP-binding protein [Nicoletella semolina]TCP18459.1 cobalt/nickel transport system ATP-binding protein [Nicoletella semolina]